MALTDGRLQLDGGTPTDGAGLSANWVDSGSAYDIGEGAGVSVFFKISEAFDTGAADDSYFQAVADGTVGGPTTIIASVGPLADADLVVNAVIEVAIPPGIPAGQYLRAAVASVAGLAAGGEWYSWIGPARSGFRSQADATPATATATL